MNEQLKNLYNSKWTDLSSKLNEILEKKELKLKPTNPLLISLENNDYENSDIKVMIFGQETNSWYGNFNGNLGEIMGYYKKLFNDNKKSKGQFSNGRKKLIELLEQKYPNKKIGTIWNNVVKIGCAERHKNTPPKYIYDIEKENFKVIKSEIEILKPDIILFLSGPNYDYRIENSFGKFKSENIGTKFSQRQLSKVEIGFGKNVFRTYHPNYLYRTGDIDSYFNQIIDQINL
jgi:hypothetical protein